MTDQTTDKFIRDLQMEVAFAQRQLDLLSTSRQRMMKRTVQASLQRDTLIDAIRDAVATRDLRPLESLLADVATGAGLWAAHTGTDRVATYREVRP